MIKYLGMVLYLAIMVITVDSSYGQANADEADVRKSFTGYKSSIMNGQGEEALGWVDSNTLEYYSNMLELSISADSATVNNLDLMDKLMVLTVRHRVPKEKVFSMSGNTFLIYAIDEGMVGKNSVMTLEIGEISVNGNSAQGQVVNNGIAAPLYFEFNKESDGWKIDITSIFGPSSAALKEAIKNFGQTENEFIFQTLEMLTGKPLDQKIWHPLRK